MPDTQKQRYTKRDLLRIRDKIIDSIAISSISINVVYAGESWDSIAISALVPERVAAIGSTPTTGNDYY